MNQRYEWIYKDGKRGNGPSKGWYPNGNMKQEWNWKNGYKHGLQRYWYENGQLFYEGVFIDGRKEGALFSVVTKNNFNKGTLIVN